MYCQRCGSTLAPGARFCNTCGTAVPMTAAAAPISMARPGLVTAISILQFLGALFMLPLGIFGLVSEAHSTQADRPFGIALGVVLIVIGLLNLAAGIGLWKMREWGRILQIVLASIGLLAIPLGTIIAILLLVYFTRPHIKLLFTGKRLDQLTPEEVAVMSATGSGGNGAAGVVIAIVAVLFIIAFVGILAAIAIPNLLTALQRSRQKRTIADIRSASVKVETYRQTNNKLPETIDLPVDGWGDKMRYATDGTNYWIASAGKDSKFEEDDLSHYQPGATTNFDCDIVFANGEMQRYPEGLKE
jgi:type II secretory pathway pseudopilin PulG